jgi:hypothetical protein
MRFLNYFQDYITEARYYSDEKFNWVASNMGSWILDSTIDNPVKIQSLPMLQEFQSWLSTNTTKATKSSDDLVLATDYIDSFLNSLSPRDAQNFIKTAMERFPIVKTKIANYLKDEIQDNIGKKRGRPLGSKNKPKIDLNDPSIKVIRRLKPAPQEPVQDISKDLPPVTPPSVIDQPEVEISTPRRGRPKVFSDETSAIDRARFKQEGKDYWEYLEAKKKIVDNKIKVFNQQLVKLQSNIDKRKKFWEIE